MVVVVMVVVVVVVVVVALANVVAEVVASAVAEVVTASVAAASVAEVIAVARLATRLAVTHGATTTTSLMEKRDSLGRMAQRCKVRILETSTCTDHAEISKMFNKQIFQLLFRPPTETAGQELRSASFRMIREKSSLIGSYRSRRLVRLSLQVSIGRSENEPIDLTEKIGVIGNPRIR